MKTKAFKRTFFIIASLLWMFMIFMLSAQQGSASAQLSDNIGNNIKGLFPILKQLSGDELSGGMAVVYFLVRKVAHFSAYAILAILILNIFRTFKLTHFWQISISLAITAAYAVTDELHQWFIPGRDCTFYDVCIDSLGAIFGIVILYAVILPVIKYFKSKRKV